MGFGVGWRGVGRALVHAWCLSTTSASNPEGGELWELAGGESGPASSSHDSKGKQETMTVLQYTQQASVRRVARHVTFLYIWHFSAET